MKAIEALTQARFQVIIARPQDPVEANRFDHDVRCKYDRHVNLLDESSGVQQRNRATIAMTEQTKAL
jgi:hypothetical protein